MKGNEENIFDYDISETEYKVLNPKYHTRTLYLLFTSEVRRLRDLHLLFLLRNDLKNCRRIMDNVERLDVEV